MRGLNGKTYIVTGGGSGIGAATVRRLLEEGARVVVVDLMEATAQQALLEAGGGPERGMAAGLDVSDEAKVNELFSAALATFGGIDGVVNSAGIRGVGSIIDTSHELLERNIAVNLEGTFNTCQAFCRYALENGRGGSIVNISSQAGIEAVPNRLSYVASKHGVVGLTKAAALEMATKGVRVNGIAPGMIRTPMTDGMFADEANIERIRRAHPIGREGRPEEIAAAAAFLLSDDASYITGTILCVDGGITAGAPSF
jgi:meso-butanediol dehydrogenase/(S,S)-butanediol dehydrogenase/diacetyl reductase